MSLLICFDYAAVIAALPSHHIQRLPSFCWLYVRVVRCVCACAACACVCAACARATRPHRFIQKVAVRSAACDIFRVQPMIRSRFFDANIDVSIRCHDIIIITLRFRQPLLTYRFMTAGIILAGRCAAICCRLYPEVMPLCRRRYMCACADADMPPSDADYNIAR